MLPKEVLKKVRQIHIRTSKMVNDVLAGEYESVFKGRGMEFEEVREYQPGDEIRTIDWNVTARMGHPFVKQFVEERELTVILMVDASSSGKFGSVRQLKSEVAAEICALLAFSAIRNNDKVGLIVFTDQIEKFVPPKKGKTHVLRVIREALYFQPRRPQTDLAGALEYLAKVMPRRAVVFVISDFLSSGYERALRIANKRHDIVAITITDPRELQLPTIGFIELQDAETGERILIDTRDANVRKGFTVLNTKEMRERAEMFRAVNVDAIDVRTDRPYVDPIVRFFRMRERRLAR